MRRYRWEILFLFLVVAVTAAVYWPVTRAEFVAWDDDVEIYRNPHLTGLSAQSIRWMFFESGYVVRYQPMTWLTWSIIYELSGLSPSAYHLANLLCHCVNAGLVFFLIRKILFLAQRIPPGEEAASFLTACSALGALLWAVHPLRVEVVAWVSAFLHAQALLFQLIAALCYLAASSTDRPNTRTRLLYLASVASFGIALLSFPIGLGFVIVPVLFDVFLLRRFTAEKGGWSPSSRAIWLQKLPYFIVAGVVLGITLVLRFNVASRWAVPPELTQFGLLHRFMQAFYVWSYYLWKPLLPFDLSPLYTTLVSFDPLSSPFLASAGLVTLLTLLLFWKRRPWPLGWALWLCHLFYLVPVLGLTEHPHFPSDRYSLAPGILWSLLAAWGVATTARASRTRVQVTAATAVIVLAFSVSSFRQTAVWRDSMSLFQHVLRRLGDDPYSSAVYWRLAVEQLRRGHTDAAIDALNTAIRINPADAIPHKIVARIYFDQARMEDARAHYAFALKAAPMDAEAHNGLGAVLAAQGDWPAATAYFLRALDLDPNYASASFNVGVALMNQGKTNEAKGYFDRAARFEQSNARTR